MNRFKYGADFTAKERKRINDIIYLMKKQGFIMQHDVREHITSAKGVREQVAKVSEFQAISKSGNRVGARYSGEEAVKLRKKAIAWNRKVEKAKRDPKFKGYDLDIYKVNIDLTGLSPSTRYSRIGFMETKEDYAKRLEEEGRKAREAAERAWSRDISQMLEDKRETATQNILQILKNGYVGSIDVPEELAEEVERRLRGMSYDEFTQFMRRVNQGEFNIFEFYLSGYEEVETGLIQFLKELKFEAALGYSKDESGAYDKSENTVYVNELIDKVPLPFS